MFDKTDLEAFEINSKIFFITQTTGEALFAIFNIVAILISLNMLIAMMSNSFQRIAVSTYGKKNVTLIIVFFPGALKNSMGLQYYSITILLTVLRRTVFVFV